MAEDEKRDNYSADNIQVLEGLEAVRKRPAMYIGDVGVKGLHHLVYEVVDNSIDEALAGYCNHINVFINEDNSITVTDNGRGIPTAMHTKEKKSALEVVMTVLHAGGKFDKDTYKVSGGLHGVGVSCVNALSIHMRTEVHREGKIFEQEYSIGKPLYAVREIGTSDKTGTIQTFKPDHTIFESTEYNFDTLAARMREHALPRAPVHDDVRTLHAAALCPSIVVGGFPCQDVSTLGARAGMDGARSSLFFEIARVVDEAPSVVAVVSSSTSPVASGCTLPSTPARALSKVTTRSGDGVSASSAKARRV